VRRRRALAALAVALGLTASAPADARPDAARLTATAPGWAVAGRPLELEIRQAGALAGRPIDVLIFLDDRRIATVRGEGDRTTVRVPTDGIPAGRHALRFKSGSERGELTVRLLPAATPWAAAALAAALLGGIALLLRRRRPAA
jgi:hypothetical protein